MNFIFKTKYQNHIYRSGFSIFTLNYLNYLFEFLIFNMIFKLILLLIIDRLFWSFFQDTFLKSYCKFRKKNLINSIPITAYIYIILHTTIKFLVNY